MIELSIQNLATIKNLELEIPENKLTVFFGHNYAGKSNAMLGIKLATFGRAYYIEGAEKASPSRLIRHGQNNVFAQIKFPTFTASYSHNNGKLARLSNLVDSDKNEEHDQATLRHIGADRFANLSSAINRFFYVNPQSKNLFTILPSERKAYLLERWDFSELQTDYKKAVERLNEYKKKSATLDSVEIVGVETDTKQIKETIAELYIFLKDKPHYELLQTYQKVLEKQRAKLKQLEEDAFKLEDSFITEARESRHKLVQKELDLQSLGCDEQIDRKYGLEQIRQLEFRIKLVVRDLDKIGQELLTPLSCKKCGAEHYQANGDIFLFNRDIVLQLKSELMKEKDDLQSEHLAFMRNENKWAFLDDIADAKKCLSNLEMAQNIRRVNIQKEIECTKSEIKTTEGVILDIKDNEERWREFDKLERELAIAKSANEIVVQARKQKEENARLKRSIEGLEFVAKIGIPNIIHEAAEQPLINLVAEINRGLEAVEVIPRVGFRLSRNGDNLPKDIELPIMTDGYEQTFASINSQGLARCIAFASLVGEFATFGSPFSNLQNMILWDDPFWGCFDLGEFDVKSRLARMLGKFQGGTRIVATGDEDTIREMNPDCVYRFEIVNGETKVSRI